MTTKEKILALIKLEKGLKQSDVAKKLGLSDSTVDHHLRDRKNNLGLIQQGMVKVRNVRKKGEWIIKQPYVTNTKILEYTGPE